eukprot:scaffold2113_cov233-Pinguiococcus_pyrenoidosus.AAC.2
MSATMELSPGAPSIASMSLTMAMASFVARLAGGGKQSTTLNPIQRQTQQARDEGEARRGAGQLVAAFLRHPAASAGCKQRALSGYKHSNQKLAESADAFGSCGYRHAAGNDPKYQNVDPASLPFTESLKITAERVLPYWEDVIVPDLKAGNTLLVAAHGNSLRALVMHLDSISEEDITELNIPTGVPLVYKLDDNMKPIKSDLAIEPLQGRYLGDQEAVRERILGVKNQTK